MALADRPYFFLVPDGLPEAVEEAFLACFTSQAGQQVLDHLYWQVMMRDPADLREVGRQDLFRFILDLTQRGWMRQHGVTDGNGQYPPQ